MKVALVCPYAWDRPGGVQVHVRQLAGHLGERGHETLVLAPASRGIRAERVEVVGGVLAVPYNGSISPLCLDPRSYVRIRRSLRAFGPDVVHVHEPFSPLTSLEALVAARAPLVGTFHAYAQRSIALAALSPALRPLWTRMRVRLAVSEAAAEYAGRHFRGAVRVVPNGADVELFRDASPSSELPAGRKLMFVNRLEPRKGFGVAVRAFGLLAGEHPDLHLIVAGNGAERDAVGVLPA